MNDFVLAVLIGNVLLIVGGIWWWGRFGRSHDRWRVPVGGVVVAATIVLVALVGEKMLGR